MHAQVQTRDQLMLFKCINPTYAMHMGIQRSYRLILQSYLCCLGSSQCHPQGPCSAERQAICGLKKLEVQCQCMQASAMPASAWSLSLSLSFSVCVVSLHQHQAVHGHAYIELGALHPCNQTLVLVLLQKWCPGCYPCQPGQWAHRSKTKKEKPCSVHQP